MTTNGDNELLSIDGENPPVVIADGFIVTQNGSVFAVDPEQGTLDLFAVTSGLSTLAFGPDGTLYVARFTQNRIDTLTADGTLTAFVIGLELPDGIAVDADGSRLFVSHFPNGSGRIDEISIPDAVVTLGPAANVQAGFYVTQPQPRRPQSLPLALPHPTC